MTRRPNPKKHPARFSESVIAALRELIPHGSTLHDPFAGTGEFLGQLANDLSCDFSGTELEECLIVDRRVKCGDATDASTYPNPGYVLVTSPVYPNGVADNFRASDASTRKTYRQAVAHLEGEDRLLHPNNMGQYGYRGTSPRSGKRASYWDLANAAVALWGGASLLLVNVSDFMADDKVEPVVKDWKWLLEQHGWSVDREVLVTTPRYRQGSNESRDQRVDHEVILVATRAP